MQFLQWLYSSRNNDRNQGFTVRREGAILKHAFHDLLMWRIGDGYRRAVAKFERRLLHQPAYFSFACSSKRNVRSLHFDFFTASQLTPLLDTRSQDLKLSTNIGDPPCFHVSFL